MGEEIIELSDPWKPKSKFKPPKTDNQDFRYYRKKLLNPKEESRVQDNLKNTERVALYCLANYNKDIKSKNLMGPGDKGSRLVIECKEQYIKEIFSYLSNKKTFQEDESDQSKMYQQKVNNWTKLWEHNLTKDEIEWINKKEIQLGRLCKC